jgi:alpha-tubulin suppressor-like RCC1 family protein
MTITVPASPIYFLRLATLIFAVAGGLCGFAQTAPSVALAVSPRQVVAAGQSLTLTVTPIGTPAPTLQWLHNGRAVPNATAASFTLVSARSSDGGYYQVVATNSGGAATSAAMFVNVDFPSEIVAWGSDASGQSTPSAGLTNVVAFAAGRAHSAALKADGTVVVWGDNTSGQTTVPADLANAVALAAGTTHTLALRDDGTVVAWGGNSGGQSKVPAELNGVVAIAAGASHSLALRGDGTVVAWGTGAAARVPLGLVAIVAVAAGDNHSLALTADGTVFGWGDNTLGQTAVPSGLVGVTALAAGTAHSLALKANGAVVGWGDNTSSQRVIPSTAAVITAIAASGDHSLALKADGTVLAWGRNTVGQSTVPTWLAGVVTLAAGADHSLVVRSTAQDRAPTVTTSPQALTVNPGGGATFSVVVDAGTALNLTYQWRKGGVALAGANASSFTFSYVRSSDLGNYDVVVSNALGQVTSGSAALTFATAPSFGPASGGRFVFTDGASRTLSAAATIGAATFQWRRNGVTIPGATARTYVISNPSMRDSGYYQLAYNEGRGLVVSPAVYLFFTRAPAARTQVVAWGGDNPVLTTVPGDLQDAVAVAAENGGSLVLRANGMIAAWGSAAFRAPSGDGFVAVAGGLGHALALSADGTVVAWGANDFGATTVPAGLDNVVAIAAGGLHSLALRVDGTVIAWGDNSKGQASVPADLRDVVAIAAGNQHSLAVKADGTVRAWGDTRFGKVTLPSQLSNVVAVAANDGASFALKADGSVISWGDGTFGQTASDNVLRNLTSIAASGNTSIGVRTDGTVVAWGQNDGGKTSVPTTLYAAFGAAISYRHVLVVRESSQGEGPPVITTQPAPISAYSGQDVTLNVVTSGGSPGNNYQWRKNGAAFANATQTLLRIPRAQPSDAGVYDVVVSNLYGSVTSDSVAVNVNATVAAVTVAGAAARVVNVGETITFTASSSFPALGFQWLKNNVPVTGATSASLTLANAQPADAGIYACVATNSAGGVTSASVVLTVNVPVVAPVVTAQPVASRATAGGEVVFTVKVSGSGLSYQWRKDGVALVNGGGVSGATAATLVLTGVAARDAGSYDVVLSNASGSATSAAVMLAVDPSARLANLSVRANLASAQTLIVGFVLNTGAKDILVRASGPALEPFVGPGFMADPKFALYQESVELAENDDWSRTLSPSFAAVGALPFPTGSKDAALLQTLSGSATALVTGTGEGIVLVEAYDAEAGTSTRLVNLSARNRVGVGADVLIAGFYVAGTGTKQLLIRAAGPELSDFGVIGVLADPKLELYDSRSVKIGANDNWDPALASTFAQVGAFPFTLGSKDAAFVVTLNAGSTYSVQVSGADGGTGEALVEIYELP